MTEPLNFGQCRPSESEPFKQTINRTPVSARTQEHLDSAMIDVIRHVSRPSQGDPPHTEGATS